jgi:hypothetical protein
LTAQREDSGVYTDMVTADYSTGTSSTGVFQDDGPDSPTSLTITAFSSSINLVVGLPSYLAAGSVIEIWEYTASTPFGSATKIAEGLNDTFVLQRRDTVTRYYWTRIRDVHGQVSGTYPASTGQAGATDPGFDNQTASISSVSISQVQHIPDGFSFNDTLASISYTPTVDCDIIITANFLIDYTTDGAASGAASLAMSIQDGTFDGFKKKEFYDKPGVGQNTRGTANVVQQFSGTAGVGVTYKVCAAKFVSGDTVTCSNGQMILQAFKN